MRRRDQQGFTLVELLVTITIFAIVSSMAMPVFNQTVRRSQLNDDAREFANSLVALRTEAVLRQKERTMIIGKESKAESEEEGEDGGSEEPLDWSPTANTQWATGHPSSLTATYNMMGRLKSDTNLCFVLQHQKDPSKQAVIIARVTGSVIYDKKQTDCPANLGVD